MVRKNIKKEPTHIRDEIEYVERNGRGAQGKSEYIRSLKGEYLNRTELSKAMCYYCCGFYIDGTFDCGCDICPNYSRMPYKKTTQKDGEVKVE